MDPETLIGSLYRLAARQWRVILALLICVNLIVYATVVWLWWAYVYLQPPLPEPLTGPLATPTLRPTFTPTWTPTAGPTRMPTRTPSP